MQIQFSCSVVSDSLWPHGLQHVRLPCPSPTPKAYSTHVHQVGDAIQPSHPLLSRSSPAFNLFPASGSFPVSQLFASGSQSIRVSASASVFPINIQDWFPLELMGLISLLSQESYPTPEFKSINSSALSFLYSPTLTSIHDYWKNHSLD